MSLKSLDVSGNGLTSLFESGLTGCTRLEVLNLAGNSLGDPAHSKYFGLLPALKVLDTRGNPFAADKRARWVGGLAPAQPLSCRKQSSVYAAIRDDVCVLVT